MPVLRVDLHCIIDHDWSLVGWVYHAATDVVYIVFRILRRYNRT